MTERFRAMSDREVLVSVATKMDYIEQSMAAINSNIDKHVANFNKAIECEDKKIDAVDSRVDNVERKQYWLAGAIAVGAVFIEFLKDPLSSMLTKK
jgi:prefoldin subunit 5